MYISSIFILFLSSFGFSHSKKVDKVASKAQAAEESAIERFRDISIRNEVTYSLTNKNFTKYVSERPRYYSAALFFTAIGKKYQCPVCETTLNHFKEAAEYYRNQYSLNATDPSNRLVFFVLDVDSARTVFEEAGIQSVPRIFVLPPKKVGSSKQKMSEFELDSNNAVHGAKFIIEDIQNISGIKIDVTIEPWSILFGLGLFAGLLALLVSLATRDLGAAIFWYRSSKIWMTISLVCFAVGVSGTIYCVIRSTPFYGSGRQGLRLFSGQNRDQFVIEGIIIALLTVGAAMSMVAMHYATKIKYSLLRHLLVILFMSVFLVLSSEIWGAYCDKTRWYTLKDTLPKEVWAWLTSSVKKNTGIWKRLYRISEFCLFEYKDFEGLKKKLKILVVDYLYRRFFGTTASIPGK